MSNRISVPFALSHATSQSDARDPATNCSASSVQPMPNIAVTAVLNAARLPSRFSLSVDH